MADRSFDPAVSAEQRPTRQASAVPTTSSKPRAPQPEPTPVLTLRQRLAQLLADLVPQALRLAPSEPKPKKEAGGR